MPDSQRIEDLRRRVQKDPGSIAFAQLAEECRRAGLYEEAVTVCRTGLDLHPGYLSARVTLGRALIELNDLEIALTELEYVLKSAPENLAAIRGLAEIHHRQGRLKSALAQYRAALVLARNDPDLQRTVDELAYQLEPPAEPKSDEGLSLEQMQDEFLQNLSPPPPVEPLEPDPQAVELEPVADPPPAPPLLLLASAVEFERVPVEESPDAAGSERTRPATPDAAAWHTPDAAAWPALDTATKDSADTAERDRALRVIVALEHWLDAVHVARAQLRA